MCQTDRVHMQSLNCIKFLILDMFVEIECNEADFPVILWTYEESGGKMEAI